MSETQRLTLERATPRVFSISLTDAPSKRNLHASSRASGFTSTQRLAMRQDRVRAPGRNRTDNQRLETSYENRFTTGADLQSTARIGRVRA
jgi:hypothetical protein